jgi:hypothetical protein
VVSFTPWPCYPQYPLYRRLGGPQRRSGRRGEEKILDPTGTQTPTPLSSSQSLFRLSYCSRRRRNSRHVIPAERVRVPNFAESKHLSATAYRTQVDLVTSDSMFRCTHASMLSRVRGLRKRFAYCFESKKNGDYCLVPYSLVEVYRCSSETSGIGIAQTRCRSSCPDVAGNFGSHLASYPVGKEGSFRGGRTAEA